jgi:mono/diheme cytochrome c family protein
MRGVLPAVPSRVIQALRAAACAATLSVGLSAAQAQTPAPQPRQGVGPADRPIVDAAAADRGRHVWATECITCHGAQARGTETGPNLIRSMVVLRDRYGSELGPFLKKGHPMQSGAPSASLTEQQIVDVTHFLRQRINDTLRGSAVFVPQEVVVGNPQAGAAFFAGDGKCGACHSTSGDLAGVGTRIGNPVDLQQRLLFPTGRGRGGNAALKVTLTPPSGQSMSGTLVQMDDFYVTYRDADGAIHVVRRSAGLKVVKGDPLQAHHDLLRTITDQNIYDLIAYLSTLK